MQSRQPPSRGCFTLAFLLLTIVAASTLSVPYLSAAAQTAPIKTLAVRIETDDGLFAGTDMPGIGKDVYFDIGAVAWHLNDLHDGDFPAGSTVTINLPLPDLGPHGLTPTDIWELRLEKKGILGYTDAPDNAIDLAPLAVPTSPEALISIYQHQVGLASYALSRAQAAEATLEQVYAQALADYTKAIDRIHSIDNDIETIPSHISAIRNRYLDLSTRLARLPASVLTTVYVPWISTDYVLHPSLKKVSIPIANKVAQDLATETSRLVDDATHLQARLQDSQSNRAAALLILPATRATMLTAKGPLDEARLSLAAAQLASDGAKAALVRIQEYAARVKVGSINIAQPGEWKPRRVTLIVDGTDYATADIHDRLRAGHSTFTKFLRTMSPAEQFINALRVVPPKGSRPLDERIALASTIGKFAGVSGWQSASVPFATVEGDLIRKRSVGTDGYVSLDLRVSSVNIDGRHYDLAHGSFAAHPRYLRIEYKHRNDSGVEDDRYWGWCSGHFNISAPTAWDTDRGGFLELHPDSRNEIVTAEPQLTPGTVGDPPAVAALGEPDGLHQLRILSTGGDLVSEPGDEHWIIMSKVTSPVYGIPAPAFMISFVVIYGDSTRVHRGTTKWLAPREMWNSEAVWNDERGHLMCKEYYTEDRGPFGIPPDSIPASWPTAYLQFSGILYSPPRVASDCHDVEKQLWRSLRVYGIRKPRYRGRESGLQRLMGVVDSLDAVLPKPTAAMLGQGGGPPTWTEGGVAH